VKSKENLIQTDKDKNLGFAIRWVPASIEKKIACL
jgi:hypothetical protein